jgi:hypothetical protein
MPSSINTQTDTQILTKDHPTLNTIQITQAFNLNGFSDLLVKIEGCGRCGDVGRESVQKSPCRSFQKRGGFLRMDLI